MAAAAVVCSCIPDLDVFSFALGIPYEAPLGHRGFSHSLLFAALCGALAAGCAVMGETNRRRKYFAYAAFLGCLTASHGLLDALTNGGHGIGFFVPFDNSRYFLPWEPIEVSPIGAAFFSARGATVILSEVVWVWVPCGSVWLAAAALRRRKRRSESQGLDSA